MKDRIIQFLRENSLTSTKFADVIGVQRSSISHILSGRNKPSFDFIEKMLVAYPDINAQWLITGKGNMYPDQPSLFNQKSDVNSENLSSRESNIQKEPSIVSSLFNSNEHNNDLLKNEKRTEKTLKEIDSVMIFYSDGTFKEYKTE